MLAILCDVQLHTKVLVMSQRLLLMDTKLALVTWREAWSPTSVTEDSICLEMQPGHVYLMDSGQGFSQSVIVRSMLQCNI